MPKPPKRKVRINITMKPELLKKVDDAAGALRRSEFIGEACEMKLGEKK